MKLFEGYIIILYLQEKSMHHVPDDNIQFCFHSLFMLKSKQFEKPVPSAVQIRSAWEFYHQEGLAVDVFWWPTEDFRRFLTHFFSPANMKKVFQAAALQSH